MRGVETVLEDSQKVISTSFTEMMLVLQKAGVHSMGDFFREFMDLTDKLEKAKAEKTPLLHAIGRLDPNDMVEMSDELRACLTVQAEWMKFLLKHGSVNVSIDDPANWSRSKLISYLQEHQIVPSPMPATATLVKVAQQMVKFCFACFKTLDTMPDQDQAAALGRQSMGIASEQDQRLIDEHYDMREKPVFYIDPQVPSNLQLTALEPWQQAYGCTEPYLKSCREVYMNKYYGQRRGMMDGDVHVYDKVLQKLEAVAKTYDKMRDREGDADDWFLQIDAEETTQHAQTLAIRPLAALKIGTVNSADDSSEHDAEEPVIPLFAVEYHYSRKVDLKPSDYRTFLAGTKETTKTIQLDASVDEVEMIIALLKLNRKNLDNTDEHVRCFGNTASEKDWKFSVVRGADPNKKGGVDGCAVCGKRAPLKCSRCKVEPYW